MAKDPLTVLKRIMDEHPKASERRWRELYFAEVMADEDLKHAVIEAVFKDIIKDFRPKPN
jgi:hypothetical protein